MSKVGVPFKLMPHTASEVCKSMRKASLLPDLCIVVQLPKTDDEDAWHKFWIACGQSWRSKPKISIERQVYLVSRYMIPVNIALSTYPFKNIKLTRADVEWMLWNKERFQTEALSDEGYIYSFLDLRGADLRKINLTHLSLEGVCFGLNIDDIPTPLIRIPKLASILVDAASAHLEGAILDYTQIKGCFLQGIHLEGASLYKALLENVNLEGAYLKGINLQWSKLKRVDLCSADLEGAYCYEAHLEGTNFNSAHLEGAYFKKAFLANADFSHAELAGACFIKADLKEASFYGASLVHAELQEADLEHVDLSYADLEGAFADEVNLVSAQLYFASMKKITLRSSHLENIKAIGVDLRGADLSACRLEGALLTGADLGGANLEASFFDATTNLRNVKLGTKASGFVSIADVQWESVNLAVLDWSLVKMLGDEHKARKSKTGDRKNKKRAARLSEYKSALRANRQIAVALNNQGLSENAAYFAYRAQRLHRVILRRQGKFGQYMFSLFLDGLAGYGYRPGRSIIAYLVIILFFTGLYLLNAHFVSPHLRWDEALVLSLSSFHGRGFFSQEITLGDTYARLSVIEAVIGLLVEVSLVATFTQRFFGK